MDTSAKVQITKLNDENYQVWKYKMELLLIKEDLWTVIVDAAPTTAGTELTAWNKKDGKARAHIGLFIEDNQIIHVKSKTTAKLMWTALEEYHQKSTLSNKVRLLRRLCRMLLPEGGNMHTHLNAMDECMDNLVTLGEPIVDTFSVALYLSSLPESYGVLITALESRAEADLTKNMVKGKLLEEYRRRQEIENVSETGEKALKVNTEGKSFDSTQAHCFFCKRVGHVKADCRKFAAWKKKKDSEKHNKKQANLAENEKDDKNEVVCLMVSRTKVNSPEWCVDSGASAHMCNNETVFKNLVKTEDDSVKMADGRHLPIKGNGIMNFETVCSKFRLNNVQFIPGLECNLLSVGKLAKSGCRVVFEGETCEISKNGQMLLVVKERNGVYKVTPQHQAHNAVIPSKSKCIHEWHKVLGHRNLIDIRKMSELAVDMDIAKCDHEDICETCIQCKQTKDSFPRESFTNTGNKLDLIHTDVCGPLQLPTPGGNRYILTLIDDHTRYSHIYLIKHKSDVREKMIEFVNMMKTQHGIVPKVIRSDRGGEYMDNELQKYFKANGMKTQLTVPKTPEQNGIAERKNRTLIEMTRCMLASSGLHKQFWGEAVTTANHIINRLPTKNVDSTPYELWHGKQPNLNYFHVFGAPVYAHIPKDQRKKLDDTAQKLFFVGYELGTKGFRLLNKSTYKIKISRNVKFIPVELCTKPVSEIPVNISEAIEVQFDDPEPEESQPQAPHEERDAELSGPDSEGEVIAEVLQPRKVIQRRVSTRPTKGIPPQRFNMEANKVIKEINTDPITYEAAMDGPDSEKWQIAMNEEIESLRNFGTWEVTKLPPGTNAIGCKWVYKTKTDQNGNIVKYKARLVAQGFSQKFGRDYDEVFAPVASPTTLKILLAVAGKRNMQVRHFDIQTAYLNGDLSHEVYMKQPKGYAVGDSSQVCKLVKNLYGLKQGANEWNKKFNAVMKKCGYIQSLNDPCLYTKKAEKDVIYITNHVDDIVVAATHINLINIFQSLMSQEFSIKNLGTLQYYLGIQFERDDNGVFYANQEKYIINKLHEFNLTDVGGSTTPINTGYLSNTMNQDPFESQEIYRSAIGSLLYLSTNTRPDIAIATSILARRVSDPRLCDWNEVKRVFRYLKATMSLKLKLGNDDNDGSFKCYVDADWAGDHNDRKSNTGYCFIFNGALIAWASRKQTSVALSSTEAEFVAFAEALRELIWIQRVLNDFDEELEEPIKVFEDNQGCIKLLNDRTCHQRVKHIDIKYKFVHDYISSKQIVAVYCPTDNMIADMLTKPLDGQKLSRHARGMGLI